LVWTTTPITETEVIVTGLNLTQAQTYYFNVKSVDNVDNISSSATSSDGITLNKSNPRITSIAPADLSIHYIGNNITIICNATDDDGDDLEYQFSVDAALRQGFSSENTCVLDTNGFSTSQLAIKIEVRDISITIEETINIYVVHEPIGPPDE